MTEEVVHLPELDETPKVWRDGEVMLQEEAEKADPEVIAQGERIGLNMDDWVEDE